MNVREGRPPHFIDFLCFRRRTRASHFLRHNCEVQVDKEYKASTVQESSFLSPHDSFYGQGYLHCHNLTGFSLLNHFTSAQWAIMPRTALSAFHELTHMNPMRYIDGNNMLCQ